jgi:hypothetical protein
MAPTRRKTARGVIDIHRGDSSGGTFEHRYGLASQLGLLQMHVVLHGRRHVRMTGQRLERVRTGTPFGEVGQDMDEGYMPYLDEDWPIIVDPIVSAVFAAKYYQRIVGGGRYPVFADPARPAPEDNYRVRLGWASPSALKSSPNGTLFQNVKKRFDIDLAELGLKISDLPPPNAEQWPGLKAVVAGLKGFPVTWK